MRNLLLLSLLAGCQSTDPWARAYVIGDLSETIGGPKALARPGDFMLENDRIRVAILGARTSMGPHTTGASILDADLQRPSHEYLGGNGNDQLAEVFPTVNLNVQTADETGGTVEVVADGSDGGAAVICTEGPEQSFITLLDPLWAYLWPSPRPLYRMRTDYTLQPGDGAVQIRTYAVFADESPCGTELDDAVALPGSDEGLAVLDYALETGLVMGDFYLQGGSIDVFVPEVGFDETTYLRELELGGVNTMQDPIQVDFLAGVGAGVSYGLMAGSGSLYMPLFTSSQTVAVGAGQAGDGTNQRFADGTTLYYDRWFAVGRGDVGSTLDALLEVQGVETGRVEGFVVEEGTGVALSGVHVFAFEPDAPGPWTEWTTDVGDDPHPDGSFGGTLPVGDWEIVVHGEGRPESPRIPVTVSAASTQHLVLTSPQPSSVRFRVVDETGLPVPAKVTFFAQGDSPRNSALGDGYIAGDPAQIVFSTDGHGQAALPPGTYVAMASRGIEYEIDASEPFTVGSRQAVEIDLQVVRSVDTTGWVSADLHVHAAPSFDSGITLADRVTTMAAEGVEFMTSNDHDVITDYRPVIYDLGLEPWVSSAIGIETTTLELGHFLGFPLVQDVMGDAGGAFDWTGLEPQEIIDGIRGLGAAGSVQPVVFVGHPRDGILGYFDQYNLNAYEEESGDYKLDYSLLSASNPLLSSDVFTADFDAFEILNSKRFELIRTPTQPELDAYGATVEAGEPDPAMAYAMIERTMDEQADLAQGVYTLGYGRNGPIDDWFTLLNLGYRFTALGNSDSHDAVHIEAGCPRNYVVAPTDDPAFLDETSVADAVREGRVVTTYGPFVRFFAGTEASGPGSTVEGDSVTFTIEVQSPTWFDVDRVELYENGTLIQEWSGSDISQDDVLNLLTDTTVNPTKDSWYVVIVMGDDDLSPVFTPVEIPAIQLQDVVMGALSGLTIADALGSVIPVPTTFPVFPYAVTNPIWVDADGDGDFTPPGLPDWLVEPTEPESKGG